MYTALMWMNSSAACKVHTGGLDEASALCHWLLSLLCTGRGANDITTSAAITQSPERKHDSERGQVTGSWGKAELSW